jgi:CMP/dCMP kinase
MGVITLSRQLGSDGDEIAELVCERLGYQRFDKKTMTQIGEELGMAGAIVDRAASVSQIGPKGLLERWFGNYENVLGDPSGWTFGARSDALIALSVADLRKLIDAGYEKGNAVIVGRGGMAALQDKPDVLHVRIVAPLEVRIKRVQKREGVAEEEARERVAWRDQTDVEWIKRYFDLDSHEPGLYDLIINTRKITPAAAADMVIDAFNAMQKKA